MWRLELFCFHRPLPFCLVHLWLEDVGLIKQLVDLCPALLATNRKMSSAYDLVCLQLFWQTELSSSCCSACSSILSYSRRSDNRWFSSRCAYELSHVQTQWLLWTADHSSPITAANVRVRYCGVQGPFHLISHLELQLNWNPSALLILSLLEGKTICREPLFLF